MIKQKGGEEDAAFYLSLPSGKEPSDWLKLINNVCPLSDADLMFPDDSERITFSQNQHFSFSVYKICKYCFYSSIIKRFCCPCDSSLHQSNSHLLFHASLFFLLGLLFAFTVFFVLSLLLLLSCFSLPLVSLQMLLFAQGFVFNCIFLSLFFLPIPRHCRDASLCCPRWQSMVLPLP